MIASEKASGSTLGRSWQEEQELAVAVAAAVDEVAATEAATESAELPA